MTSEEEQKARRFYIESDISGTHTPTSNTIELDETDLFKLMTDYATHCQIQNKAAEIIGTKEEYEESRFHTNRHRVELMFETALKQGTFAISTPVCDKPCGLTYCKEHRCIFSE